MDAGFYFEQGERRFLGTVSQGIMDDQVIWLAAIYELGNPPAARFCQIHRVQIEAEAALEAAMDRLKKEL